MLPKPSWLPLPPTAGWGTGDGRELWCPNQFTVRKREPTLTTGQVRKISGQNKTRKRLGVHTGPNEAAL